MQITVACFLERYVFQKMWTSLANMMIVWFVLLRDKTKIANKNTG